MPKSDTKELLENSKSKEGSRQPLRIFICHGNNAELFNPIKVRLEELGYIIASPKTNPGLFPDPKFNDYVFERAGYSDVFIVLLSQKAFQLPSFHGEVAAANTIAEIFEKNSNTYNNRASQNSRFVALRF